ncbi:MAG: bifunctional 5,10-methylenetetrahydrofolate dehydrogenase/5,10-methenyltetrahydrofolate cyclohydrolase [bacterium]|nr:bifunctional 5,10-methylenetetrahydrofolate dehydrogenase/5,10-methenyltetrahydrofolate cyclohydrolase [bacterium]
MTATIVNGKEISASILDDVSTGVADITAQGKPAPTLAIVVSDDPAALSYTKSITKKAEGARVETNVVSLPGEEDTGRSTIKRLAEDDAVNGIILQTPFIDRTTDAELAQLIPFEKDVDGQSSVSAGALWAGRNCFIPSTAAAAVHILEHYGVEFSGAEAVIIGRSPVVGKPAAALLIQRNCTVTVTHTRTRDLVAHTRRADIIILAAGKAGLLNGDMIRPGVAVIDCGYNYVGGKAVGDADFDSVSAVAGLTNKAAGGVGPVTTAILLQQVLNAALLQS